MVDRRPEQPLKPTLVIHLLGAFSVSVDRTPIPDGHWRSRRAKGLVKLLALAPGHRLHREQVIDALWPGSAPESAYNNFHNLLFTTRQILDKALPGCLVLEEGFLSLTQGEGQDVSVDVGAFEAAARQAKENHTAAAYQTALALYTGDLLPDDRYEAWTQQPREALRQAYLGLLLGLGLLQEKAGDYPEGIATLQRLMALDPTHEEAHRGLMHLYARSGQRQQALRQFQTLKEALRSELEVEPGQETVLLYEAIQSGQFAAAVDKPAPPEPAAAEPPPPPLTNLPEQYSSFIGREAQVAEVNRLVQNQRMVTLTGAGGTGKTRLALQSARAVLEHFPEGVFLVELAPVSDPSQAPRACAQVFGLALRSEQAILDTLVHYLKPRRLLLVLDNCEHLLEACARLADHLLRACPELHILATSREALALAGETVLRVSSLELPAADATPEQIGLSEAVCLFSERAAQVRQDFSLSGENAGAVARVCRRLDGIPLAIELAAARVRAMSVEQIAGRLDDVFRLLTGGSRAAMPRQQTLKALFDWSYDLLGEQERLCLQRLSVFSGGWDLEAAEAVCEGEGIATFEVLDLLSQLVDKSLVVAKPSRGGTRYHLLETVRQYGLSRLLETGASQLVRDRHLAYFAGLTGEAEKHLRSWGQVEWMDRIEQELDNLRSAMEWAASGPIEMGLQIAADLENFWGNRTYFSEGTGWLSRLLTLEKNERDQAAASGLSRRPELDLQRGRGLRAYAWFIQWLDSHTFEERLSCLEESVRLLRGLGAPARHELEISRVFLFWFKGSQAQDKPELLEILQQADMRFYYAESLLGGGPGYRPWVAAKKARFRERLEENLGIRREIGDLSGAFLALALLARLALDDGDYPRALELSNESIAVCQQTGNRLILCWCLQVRSNIALAQDDVAAARHFCRLVLEASRQAAERDPWQKDMLDVALESQLKLAWVTGDYAGAEQLGREFISLDTAGAAKHYLARTALSMGNDSLAESRFKSMIHFSLIRSGEMSYIEMGYIALLCKQGHYPQAARLFGATEAAYRRAEHGLPPRERKENEQTIAELRAALGEEAFARAYAEGQALAQDETKAYLADEFGIG